MPISVLSVMYFQGSFHTYMYSTESLAKMIKLGTFHSLTPHILYDLNIHHLLVKQIRVVARDQASIPKSATATIYINIVRNAYAPIFDQPEYTASISDYWATGRELFAASAVDDDRQVTLSRNTPNAEFDYLIDPDYPYSAQYFGITKDGTLYVRQNLATADGRNEFEVQ